MRKTNYFAQKALIGLKIRGKKKRGRKGKGKDATEERKKRKNFL